jgi:hypothetical protein
MINSIIKYDGSIVPLKDLDRGDKILGLDGEPIRISKV